MQSFSELLRQLIKSRKIAICMLSEQSGVERTLIQKMLKGDRVPAKQSIVEALSSTLMLTPDENSALLESWLAARMGEDSYAKLSFVLDFYNGFDPSPENDLVLDTRERTVRVVPENKVVYGNLDVTNLMEAVLEMEASEEDGHIRVEAQPECAHLLDFLAIFGMRRKDLVIDHIFCMESSLNERNSLYNLNCLQATIPILASGCQYQPRFYYDSIPGHFGNTSIMPYFILTRKYVMCIAHDASYATVSSSPQYLELYSRIFQSLRDQSKAFTTAIHSPIDEISYINRLNNNSVFIEHDLISTPCLLVFTNEEMVRKYAVPTLLANADTVRSILNYMKFIPLKKQMKNMGNIYFSKRGIEHFLATGRIDEVPDDYYTPLEIPDRYRLLQSMYKASSSGKYHAVLVNGQKLRIPDNLCTYSMRNGSVFFTYTAPQRNSYTTFLITEKSIATAIQDFLNYLPKSNLVYSREETLSYLKKMLDGV